MTTPNLPPLSPAAQSVWNAAWQLSPVNCESHEDRRRQQIAAALRAAADQIKPGQLDYDKASHEFAKTCLNGMAYAANELRIIAAELEPQP